MKLVALVSGGKDSCYGMLEAVRFGHEITCLAHLRPPRDEDNEIDSFMYQSVGHNVVSMVAKAMELPLITESITGKAVSTDLHYNSELSGDEVEDLFRLLRRVKDEYPEVEGVCSGAIFSSYQRNRVEHVCSRLSLSSIGYLWRREQTQLLSDMVEDQMECILVKVASIGLMPRKHLGKTIGELQYQLLALKEKYQMNVCGEGGEYETFTLDCPLFKKRIAIDSSRTVLHSDDICAPVAYLVIDACHLEDKEQPPSSLFSSKCPSSEVVASPAPKKESPYTILPAFTDCLPCISTVSEFRDQVHVGGVQSVRSEELTLEEEVHELFSSMQSLLATKDICMDDVCFVHVYVRDMSDFGRINAVYSSYFSHQPPSRSCVESHTLSSRLVIDCYAIRGSGANKFKKKHLREVMHVQSISNWAPPCIGPYSQANVLHSSLILCAGQIPLFAPTMQIIGTSPEEQLLQCVKNAGLALEALDSNLRHVASAVVYGVEGARLDMQCRQHFVENGGLGDVYEDAECSDESDPEVDKDMELIQLVRTCPALFVGVSHLPKSAFVEIELQALTHLVVKYLSPRTTESSLVENGWKCERQSTLLDHSLALTMCWASPEQMDATMEHAIGNLLEQVQTSLMDAKLDWDCLLHIRVFYCLSLASTEDAIARTIDEVLGNICNGNGPSITFVRAEKLQEDAAIAFQVTAQDLDRLEADLWLRHQV